MRETEVCNTQTEGNLRFLRGGKSYIQLATSSPIDTGACQGIHPVAGLMVAPEPGNEPRGAFKARLRAQGRDLRAHAAKPSKMAAILKPWAAIQVRIMSWEPWLWPWWKPLGEGGHWAQAAYGYHWILASLAKELFLQAFLIAVDTRAKALNDWGLGWFKGYLTGLWVAMSGSTGRQRKWVSWNTFFLIKILLLKCWI